MNTSPSTRGLTPGSVALLLVALVVAVVLRADTVARKTWLEHDEGISYLAATGHQGEWQAEVDGAGRLAGRWAAASEWRRLLRPERFGVFRTIARDLARTDFHPPFYFWVLHLWLWAVGAELRSGAALNVLLAALMVPALFGLGRRVLKSSAEAAATALVWAAAPLAVAAAGVARQYELMALLSVLYLWQAFRYADTETALRPADHVLAALTAAAGMLTHYHFVLAASAGLAVVAARTARRDRRRLAAFGGVLLVAAAVFVAANPGFLQVARRQAALTQPYSREALTVRTEKVRTTLEGLAASPRELTRYARRATRVVGGTGGARTGLVIAALVAAAADALARRRRSLLARWLETFDADTASLLFCLLWVLGGTVALYLSFRSPGHAMGARYLATSYPLLAFVPVLLFRYAPNGSVVLTLAFCAVFMLVPDARIMRSPRPAVSPDAAFVGAGSRVVVDDLARGIAPRLLVRTDDEAQVYAAWHEDVLASAGAWAVRLRPGDVVATSPAYQPGAYGREDLLSAAGAPRGVPLASEEPSAPLPFDLFRVVPGPGDGSR